MEHRTTEVGRKPIMTAKDIAEHIKSVGQAIIEDADHIALDACKLFSIEIHTKIAPLEQVTTVHYELYRSTEQGVASRKG